MNDINVISAGDRLKYIPLFLPSPIRDRAKVAIVIATAPGAKNKAIKALDARPANSLAEWTVPFHASIVGVVFGPEGLNVKKVNSLLKKSPELVTELASYAAQTETVNALVGSLAQYEQSSPGSEGLNAALTGFSSQYGLTLPHLTPGVPTDQQATLLLRAVLPTLSNYDPLTSPGSAVVQQSAGIAASVAALFYGTPVGLAVSGAALFENMRTMMFPGTNFRSAFSEPGDPRGMQLCSKNQNPTPRTRIAYIWVLKVPDTKPPSVLLAGTASLPIASQSTLKVKCTTNAQLRLLTRARGWRLVSANQSTKIPVKVTVGTGADTLALDLSHAEIPPGEYQLAALWDWTPLKVKGTVWVRPYSDFSGIKLTPQSEDRLIENTGPATIDLTGADFEFVKEVAIQASGPSTADRQKLTFKLSTASDAGSQLKIGVDVDTTSLPTGEYNLLLTQTDGKTQAVPVVLHPPNPKIENLPLRVNLGQPSQVIKLYGTGLDRIERFTSVDASFKLDAVPEGSHHMTERRAVVTLHAGLVEGQRLAARMTVRGIHEPIDIPGALQVAPPLPEIVRVDNAFRNSRGVALLQGEIPSGVIVSFSLHTENLGARPLLEITCSNDGDTKQTLDLRPGDQNRSATLDYIGRGNLFLALDPGIIGESGCELTAAVSTSDAGTSDHAVLGRVIELPQIEKFALSNEKIGNSLYVGTLTGQDLQTIEKAGWNSTEGYPVLSIPTPEPGSDQEQTLRIELPWPSPTPNAPVYVWLHGENRGRKANPQYQ